ncbi:MAG: hypothetical protein U1E02_29915 [Hydrogenophaga sp.]|nr:hypothetical protein [Burkholderiaceae bacterium]MDZ4128359.1 hypothetical protein [Hydrogenophaga sp.]
MISVKGIHDYLSECVHGRRTHLPADEDEVWMTFSQRATNRLNTWAVRNFGVALNGHSSGRAWLRVDVERVGHVVDHRANQGVPIADVLDLLTRSIPDGPVSFSQNQSTGNSPGRYNNQVLAFLPMVKGRQGSIHGLSPCLVLEFVKLPMPHLQLVTGYWAAQKKIEALKKASF